MHNLLAMINPTTLVGQELRESLERRPELWRELRLLSADKEEVGRLTDVRGAAAMVELLSEERLAGVDLVFLCGPLAAISPALAMLDPGSSAILLSPDAGLEAAPPAVANVNPPSPERGQHVLSPHPAVVGLAQLLAPLRALGVDEAVATVVLPASMYDQAGLNELFEQTKSLLAFTGAKPTAVFGQQMGFNLLPTREGASHLAGLVTATLGERPRVALEVLQGGIFHGCSISLYVQFRRDPGYENLREALAEAPEIAFEIDEENRLGPVDAAARPEILVGGLRSDPLNPGGYWIWSVMDNIVRGSADNALRLAEILLAHPS